MMGLDVPAKPDTRVLIIGAYGLIGFGIARQLIAEGYSVVGLGRNADTGNRVLPDIAWIVRDVGQLRQTEDWSSSLDGISVVVNCSGALQDGPDDNLEAVHTHAVSALATACAQGGIRLIQISAVGAHEDASTAFLVSKARGDAAIRASGAEYQIFRPGLVLAPHAYGGTALLRMLAAVPLVQPLAVPDAQIQTVSLADVSRTVSAAVAGKLPNRFECDLVEPTPHPLRDVVAAMRRWLGFGAARWEICIPNVVTGGIGKLADGVSRLGWRPPLRTTSLKVLATGVRGAPADLTGFGLPQVSSLSQSLAAMPATVEDRLYARMLLLNPVLIATLCLFWLASGVIGLLRAQQAATVLEAVGWSHGLAVASVVFWAIVDIAVAGAFAWRKFSKAACWAAICVSGFYLVASTSLTPHLWADPLGPLVKVIPGMVLALVARATLENR